MKAKPILQFKVVADKLAYGVHAVEVGMDKCVNFKHANIRYGLLITPLTGSVRLVAGLVTTIVTLIIGSGLFVLDRCGILDCLNKQGIKLDNFAIRTLNAFVWGYKNILIGLAEIPFGLVKWDLEAKYNIDLRANIPTPPCLSAAPPSATVDLFKRAEAAKDDEGGEPALRRPSSAPPLTRSSGSGDSERASPAPGGSPSSALLADGGGGGSGQAGPAFGIPEDRIPVRELFLKTEGIPSEQLSCAERVLVTASPFGEPEEEEEREWFVGKPENMQLHDVVLDPPTVTSEQIGLSQIEKDLTRNAILILNGRIYAFGPGRPFTQPALQEIATKIKEQLGLIGGEASWTPKLRILYYSILENCVQGAFTSLLNIVKRQRQIHLGNSPMLKRIVKLDIQDADNYSLTALTSFTLMKLDQENDHAIPVSRNAIGKLVAVQKGDHLSVLIEVFDLDSHQPDV